MLTIRCDNTTVEIPSGDYGEIEVSCKWEKDGEKGTYTLQENDQLEFGLKENEDDEDFVLHKVVTGSNKIVFTPADTENVEPGSYLYSIRLKIAGDRPHTLVDKKNFIIGKSLL